MLRRLRLRRGWRDRPLRGGVMARHLPCRVSSWRCGPSWAGRRTRTCLVWRMRWFGTVFYWVLCVGKRCRALLGLRELTRTAVLYPWLYRLAEGAPVRSGSTLKSVTLHSVISAVSCMLTCYPNLVPAPINGSSTSWVATSTASTARSTPGVSLSICTAPSILGRRPSVEEVSRVTLWRHSIAGATPCQAWGRQVAGLPRQRVADLLCGRWLRWLLERVFVR